MPYLEYVVGAEARKGFPPTALWGMTTSAETALRRLRGKLIVVIITSIKATKLMFCVNPTFSIPVLFLLSIFLGHVWLELG